MFGSENRARHVRNAFVTEGGHQRRWRMFDAGRMKAIPMVIVTDSPVDGFRKRKMVETLLWH